jgi:hypothetical protein
MDDHETTLWTTLFEQKSPDFTGWDDQTTISLSIHNTHTLYRPQALRGRELGRYGRLVVHEERNAPV